MNSTSDALMTLDEYKQSLLTSIHIGITATNMDDEYSVGLRNGLRICKAYIDGQEPEYEDVQNNPLTWDELKQMEGKPVFLEQYWYPMEDEEGVTEDEVEIDKFWAIIDNVQAKRIYFVGKIRGMTISDLDPNKNGGWQAFRRERE